MYRRTTTETRLSTLPPALAKELARHAAEHLISLDHPAPRCWLTHSENPPAEGLFGRLLGRRANPVDPEAEHWTALVLQVTHILVATLGEKRGAVAMSIPLERASLSRGEPLAARYGLAGGEDGVVLSGFPGAEGPPGTIFVGLAGESGAACARAVEEAIRARRGPGEPRAPRS